MTLAIKNEEPGWQLPVVDKNDLFLIRSIGKGAYAKVYLGKIRDESQSAKSVSASRHLVVKVPQNSSPKDVDKEIEQMLNIDHVNVIKLLGIAEGVCSGCNEEDSCFKWLLLAYAPKGDLLDFVKHRKENGFNLDEGLWMKISLGIAEGMIYLHEKRIVHCDLHTKNCFLTKSNTVKIGDFGLSYTLDSNEQEEEVLKGAFGNTGRPADLPVSYAITGARWKAPEYIPGHHFVTLHLRCGDVWAFGILLYEFWSEGTIPFAGICGNREVSQCILEGLTPMDHREIPAPDYILELMEKCFKYVPNKRPKFSTIGQILKQHYVCLS